MEEPSLLQSISKTEARLIRTRKKYSPCSDRTDRFWYPEKTFHSSGTLSRILLFQSYPKASLSNIFCHNPYKRLSSIIITVRRDWLSNGMVLHFFLHNFLFLPFYTFHLSFLGWDFNDLCRKLCKFPSVCLSRGIYVDQRTWLIPRHLLCPVTFCFFACRPK